MTDQLPTHTKMKVRGCDIYIDEKLAYSSSRFFLTEEEVWEELEQTILTVISEVQESADHYEVTFPWDDSFDPSAMEDVPNGGTESGEEDYFDEDDFGDEDYLRTYNMFKHLFANRIRRVYEDVKDSGNELTDNCPYELEIFITNNEVMVPQLIRGMAHVEFTDHTRGYGTPLTDLYPDTPESRQALVQKIKQWLSCSNLFLTEEQEKGILKGNHCCLEDNANDAVITVCIGTGRFENSPSDEEEE